MEVHQLRYVCAIAEAGSFSRAAERCQVSQPSLSQQVLKLEEELGVSLFDRLGRGIRLSDAARAFLPHARTVLDALDAARASVADTHSGLNGAVAVGAIPTIAPYLIPNYATRFTQQFPDAKLRIVEDTTPVLIESVRDLSLDLAILALPLRHKDLELTTLSTEPLFAVLPPGHPRANSRTLTLAELRGETFVMLRDGHCFRDLSISACAHARITPNIAFESSQFSSLLGMVAVGIGISLVPEMAIDRNVSCRYIRLTDPRATRTIVAAKLRNRSFNPVQQAFLDGLQSRRSPRSASASPQT